MTLEELLLALFPGGSTMTLADEDFFSGTASVGGETLQFIGTANTAEVGVDLALKVAAATIKIAIATDKNMLKAARGDVIHRGDGLLLELRDCVDLLNIGDIQQVMWDERPLLRCHLGRPNIKTAIDLARIG